MGMLERIIELLKDTDVVEVEVRGIFHRIKVKRAGADSMMVPAAMPVFRESSNQTLATHITPPKATETAPSAEDDLVKIKAPMVGTFYRSPAPDAAPFVSEGTKINKGQILCIIESMKLMNEIESEFEGEIVKIHIENAKPVQFGDVMFSLKPNA